jgi:hypothetical protein
MLKILHHKTENICLNIFFFTVSYSSSDASLAEIFFLWYTVKYPGPVQVSVGEPDTNPGQLRPLSGVAQLP